MYITGIDWIIEYVNLTTSVYLCDSLSFILFKDVVTMNCNIFSRDIVLQAMGWTPLTA